MQGSTWQKIEQKLAAFPKRWRRVVIAIIGLVILLAITPAIQVIYTRFVNPTSTGPIVVSRLRARAYGVPATPPNMVWCDLGNVSKEFLTTVWLVEDAGFFRHSGFAWEQIRRAQLEALQTGKPSRGASTITQQCARSLFLWQGRSWTRKLLEAYYTIWMELLLSKKRIFELYVNVIELGDGIYGIQAAAQHYYKKDARDLTYEEALSLVVIMPRPRSWDPLQPNEDMLRRKSILRQRHRSRPQFPLN